MEFADRQFDGGAAHIRNLRQDVLHAIDNQRRGKNLHDPGDVHIYSQVEALAGELRSGIRHITRRLKLKGDWSFPVRERTRGLEQIDLAAERHLKLAGLMLIVTSRQDWSRLTPRGYCAAVEGHANGQGCPVREYDLVADFFGPHRPRRFIPRGQVFFGLAAKDR